MHPINTVDKDICIATNAAKNPWHLICIPWTLKWKHSPRGKYGQMGRKNNRGLRGGKEGGWKERLTDRQRNGVNVNDRLNARWQKHISPKYRNINKVSIIFFQRKIMPDKHNFFNWCNHCFDLAAHQLPCWACLGPQITPPTQENTTEPIYTDLGLFALTEKHLVEIFG